MNDRRKRWHIVRAGEEAWRIDFDEAISAAELGAWKSLVEREARPQVCVTGQRSLLCVGGLPSEAFLQGDPVVAESSGRVHHLDVSFQDRYGPDLPQLLARSGLSFDSFLTRVRELELRARFLGFVPGFAYLEGWPEEWQLPRLPAPRPRVPAGSFAVAGTMAGIYPSDTPGGWNLLGRTSAVIWDEEREQPNLIAPGDVVRIQVVDEIQTRREVKRDPMTARGTVAEVSRAGQQTLVVGSGDFQRLRTGLPEGGAFDRDAAEAANRAVGNDSAANVLECTLVGPDLRFASDALLSVAGADVTASIGGRATSAAQLLIRGGQTLSLGAITNGARCYVAIRGGWADDAPRYAAELTPLRVGSQLANSGGERGLFSASDRPGDGARPRFRTLSRNDPGTIEVLDGPDADERVETLLAMQWRVGDGSRGGVRLEPTGAMSGGPGLLPSSGALFGTVQWHPDGTLTILGPDHPVTGGYAQPLVVPRAQLWKVAQLRRGAIVRLRRAQKA
jgi:KipI family sensor histidine kinase inhibitor